MHKKPVKYCNYQFFKKTVDGEEHALDEMFKSSDDSIIISFSHYDDALKSVRNIPNCNKQTEKLL